MWEISSIKYLLSNLKLEGPSSEVKTFFRGWSELTCGLSHAGSTLHSPQKMAASSSQPFQWVLRPDASCCVAQEPRYSTTNYPLVIIPQNQWIEKEGDRWAHILASHFWATGSLIACSHLSCLVKRCRLFRYHTPHLPLPPPSARRQCIWEQVRQVRVLHSTPAASGTHKCAFLHLLCAWVALCVTLAYSIL